MTHQRIHNVAADGETMAPDVEPSPAHPGLGRALSSAGRRAGGALARLPRVLRGTGAGTRRALGALETMPAGTLQSLAAASLGLGAGLSFTRAGRLGALAGALPAVVIGTVLVSRPAATDSETAGTR
jgi:hypothetical protein